MLVGEQEVMGRDLAGDAEAVAAGLADGGDGGGGGGVRDVEMGAGVAELGDEADVALDDAGLGFDGHAAQAEFERYGAGVHAGALGHTRVFGVLDHAQAYAGGGGKGLAHHAVFEDGMAVVGDGYGAGGFERGVVIEGLAL